MRSGKALLGAAMISLSTATPALADECLNRALDGAASASSEHSPQHAAGAVNNGIRDTGAMRTFWNDGTQGVFGDWVKVSWERTVDLDRIVVRGVINRPDYPDGYSVIGQSRIQYRDGSGWVDVRAQPWQVNPVTYWVLPIGRGNGSEVRTFDLATTVSTREVRVMFDHGSAEGMSYLDEIEVYEPEASCTPAPPSNTTNLALSRNGGIASASSAWVYYPDWAVNNGQRDTGDTGWFWLDGTPGVWPDWVEVRWDGAKTLGRIVLRGVVNRPGYPIGYRTLRQTRVQWYDDATSSWRDVVARAGQDNPIVDWVMPVTTADGTEVKQFHFAPVETTKIRALIEDGTTEGRSWMDEIEAYAP